MNVAIITAAGSGTRAKFNYNKILARLDDDFSVIERTVQSFLAVPEIDKILITANFADFYIFQSLFKRFEDKVEIVAGGKTRQESVYNALLSCKCDYVLIHDGARPFVTPELIKKCLYKAINDNSCVPTTPLGDTIGRVENGQIHSTTRADFLSLQTPQAFKYDQIFKAHTLAKDEQGFTDDCGIYCRYIGPCSFVEGERENVKLTYPEDFEPSTRVGTGFDLHKLVEGRKLVLGGVEIPHNKGLLGHSDADAVIHALMDSILSACGLKDIGYYFPDTDQKYKDISSLVLLNNVYELIKKQGYRLINASICIMAERPKLSPYVDQMKQNIAYVLHTKPTLIGITCTTLEGLGIVGREEGIACQSYCLVEKAR